jgi:glycosyltransferase involved in cell wall biosynthesis
MLIMGVIDEWLDLETPIKALAILNKQFSQLELVIIGPWRNGDHRRKIDELVEREGLTSHIKITGYVSEEVLSCFLRNAAFCVMPYRMDRFSSIIRLPEKLFMYSSYGKPILSTHLPEVEALECKHIFFYRDVSEFINAASFILSVDTSIHAAEDNLATSARTFAEQHDTRVLAERLEQILFFEHARLSKQE